MEVPRGFTRCDECEGGRVSKLVQAGALEWPEDRRCPSCSGSGLVPTEKLRKQVVMALTDGGSVFNKADAVLAKVAEHLGGRE